MKIATDLAVHLPPGWRLADTDDLAAWCARHTCPKCLTAVQMEIEVRDRRAKRAAFAQREVTT